MRSDVLVTAAVLRSCAEIQETLFGGDFPFLLLILCLWGTLASSSCLLINWPGSQKTQLLLSVSCCSPLKHCKRACVLDMYGGDMGWVIGIWRRDSSTARRGNPASDMEPGEVLRLPGGPVRAMLRRPQPVEEPKACGEGVLKDCLEPRGRWITPLQELGVFFFIKNHWMLRSWEHSYNAGAGVALSNFCLGARLQPMPYHHLHCGFYRLWILCLILVIFPLLP